MLLIAPSSSTASRRTYRHIRSRKSDSPVSARCGIYGKGATTNYGIACVVNRSPTGSASGDIIKGGPSKKLAALCGILYKNSIARNQCPNVVNGASQSGTRIWRIASFGIANGGIVAKKRTR